MAQVPQAIAVARRMRWEGNLQREIAKSLGVCVATASVWTRGVLPYKRKPLDTRKLRTLPVLKRLYGERKSIPEIAALTGIPATTLYDWRRELELPRNRRSAYVTSEMRERTHRQFTRDSDGSLGREAVRLYVEGQTTVEIARRMNVHSVTICNWIRAAGITPRLRISLDMKLARESCFKRDNYTCRSCGQRGGKLNAHHIWPFQRFPKWKYEVWNLLTLCKRCHHAFHNAAGGAVRIAIGPFFATTS